MVFVFGTLDGGPNGRLWLEVSLSTRACKLLVENSFGERLQVRRPSGRPLHAGTVRLRIFGKAYLFVFENQYLFEFEPYIGSHGVTTGTHEEVSNEAVTPDIILLVTSLKFIHFIKQMFLNGLTSAHQR